MVTTWANPKAIPSPTLLGTTPQRPSGNAKAPRRSLGCATVVNNATNPQAINQKDHLKRGGIVRRDHSKKILVPSKRLFRQLVAGCMPSPRDVPHSEQNSASAGFSRPQ